MSFIDYLMECATEETKERFLETAIEVDLNDPAEAIKAVRQASRVHKGSPRRVNQNQLKRAKQAKKDAAQSSGKNKGLEMRVARAREQLAVAQKQLANAKSAGANK